MPTVAYRRRTPETEPLYQVLSGHLETFLEGLRATDHQLPRHVEQELRAYLKCGILSYGFLRVRCEDCGESRVVAFSCKKRGFCPSCLGRRMADTAARLVEAAGRLRFVDPETLQFSLKTPWADGTTSLLLSPTELIEKLATLVPPPRSNLIRYHGVPGPGALTDTEVALGCDHGLGDPPTSNMM